MGSCSQGVALGWLVGAPSVLMVDPRRAAGAAAPAPGHAAELPPLRSQPRALSLVQEGRQRGPAGRFERSRGLQPTDEVERGTVAERRLRSLQVALRDTAIRPR